ncbi:MAG: redoxin domain-containing protein, partial [Treponema sp.]|nr:redoxin domain-containing protein [Treponema sp.]
MRKSKIFIAFLFTLFVSAFAFAEPIKVGSLAPDFSIELSTGQTVKLSDYKGKAVFLHFWATWCPPCRVELPEMEKL